MEAGGSALISQSGGEYGALLELWQETRGSSQVVTVISGNLLSHIKGDKPAFEF